MDYNDYLDPLNPYGVYAQQRSDPLGTLSDLLGAKRAEAMISTAPPTISELEGDNRLGWLGEIAGMLGTGAGVHMLSRMLPAQYRLPALAVSGLSGAIWGGLKSYLEDKPWSEYPGNIAREAGYFMAPLPMAAAETGGEIFKTLIGRKSPGELAEEAPGMALNLAIPFGFMKWAKGSHAFLDPMIYKGMQDAIKEGRYKGLSGLIKETGENVWKELAPERAMIYNYPIPKSLEPKLGASTFGEVFTPPQERVEPEIGKAMWKREKVNRDMAGIFKGISHEMVNLNPDELNFSLKYLKTGMKQGEEFWADIPPETREKIYTLFKPLKELPESVSKAFFPHEQEYLINKVSSRIEKIFADEPIADKFLGDIKQELSASGNVENTRKGLLNIVKNPAIPDTIKSTAVALHDLPITTMDDLTRAWNNSTLDLLKMQIKSNAGSVLTEGEFRNLPENMAKRFVRITKNEMGKNWAEFDGKYLDRDIYHAMLDFQDSPGTSRSFLNKFITSPWKITKAVARFPAMFRNAFGNFWLNATTHVNPLPFHRMDIYGGVLRDMGEAMPEKLGWMKNPFSKAQTGPMAQDLKAFFNDAGLNPGVFPQELSPWDKAFKANRNMAEVLLDYFNYGVSPSTELYSFLETWAKAAKYRWNRMQGMEHWDAMTDAVRTTFHYGEVPRGVRLARETAIPFATFQSKVIPFTLENMIRNPWGMVKWYTIPWMITQGALAGLDINEKEFQEIKSNLPEYMRQGMYLLLPWRDDKGRMQLFNMTWWIPGLGDAAEMMNSSGEPGRWMQNPVFNIGADLLRNVKGGTDIPIYNDWDPPILRLAKMFGHVYQSMMPTWMPGFGRDSFPLLPGGPDFQLMLDALNERPEALTPTQGSFAQVGLKVNPIDEGLLAAKKQSRLTRLKGEIEGQMRRELRRAVSDDERNSIIQKYQGYLLNLQKL